MFLTCLRKANKLGEDKVTKKQKKQKKMNKINGQYRQGDVLIEEASIPENVVKEDGRNGVILAYGEATGHSHVLEEEAGEIYLTSTPAKDLDIKFLKVRESNKRIVHQEHSPIPTKKRGYKITRQREYTPAAIQSVRD